MEKTTHESAKEHRKARIVQPPPSTPGRSAMPPPSTVVSVVLQPGEDVEWTWASTPDGGAYVSGYTIVRRE